jgi:hypothetical protein
MNSRPDTVHSSTRTQRTTVVRGPPPPLALRGLVQRLLLELVEFTR